MAKPPKKPTPKLTKRELEQQCVLILRPSDQFMVVQGGQQKLMLVAAFVQALADIVVQTVGTMSVVPHTHPESDITSLGTDLAGKAALNHTHQISDILNNYVNATTIPPVAYNDVYPVTVKATVTGGNAVFQFTTTGLAAGTAIFATDVILNSLQIRAEEGANPIACGTPVWSNGNKTLTMPVSRTGAAVTILGLSVLGANVAANGVVVYATVFGH